MTPWWLAMLGGLLGSSHCVGMCGGFAALVGLHTGSVLGNLRAQLVYSLGRLMSYAALGAVAGFAGQRLISSLPQMINAPAVLCLAAGLLLFREGLLASGLFRRWIGGSSTAGCLFGPLFSTILKTPGARNTFVAGIATGLLPCGLVYAFVSLAATSGDLLRGGALMLAFGAGTVPLMVVTGCGVSLLSWAARQRLWQFAAWSVMITGLLTLGRGVAYLQAAPEHKTAACPFCAKNSSDSSPVRGEIAPSAKLRTMP
jgi:sulfite exporter TauE/SafE